MSPGGGKLIYEAEGVVGVVAGGFEGGLAGWPVVELPVILPGFYLGIDVCGRVFF